LEQSLPKAEQGGTAHTPTPPLEPGLPPSGKKPKSGGRLKRAFARAKAKARDASQRAREKVKQAPQNIGELIKVYGRTALLTYIAVDVCTYVELNAHYSC
jgi:hypothetical protein